MSRPLETRSPAPTAIRTLARIALATIAGLAAAIVAPCDESPGTATLVLFDGQSLDGWKKTDFYKAGEVKVEDGAIVLRDGGSMTGITSTRTDLPTTNYELRYEAMRLSGNDFFAAATFPVGKSHATLVNGGWGGTVTGLSSLDGADASENETGHFRKFQDQRWYKFRIRVTDKVIRCWIDDEEAVTVDHSDRQVGTRIEVNRNKPLGFATWHTSGAVRGIEIRRLSPAEVAETDKIADKP
jgi:hypothetical protein